VQALRLVVGVVVIVVSALAWTGLSVKALLAAFGL
jgi:hypothetical protein